MDVGASAVAFVGFGLSSINSLYQLFSSIKDGPKKLADLSGALRRLQSVFEQIDTLPDLPDIVRSTPSLAKCLAACRADIGRFDSSLQKLNFSAGERLHGLMWKRLKIAFGEKDITYMLTIVSAYADSLTLELNLIQTRAISTPVSE
ncbi:hypothetical protein B0T22DRAFT_478459 [Podospora appendiculata]|uniref:Azaphilone pigments biosynthesis cluster protein L N-terminal domain-containing protein n=1 Tax=Podospora appendiculata TaxID=314037 RepID=A0AAE1CIQ4_9PEZI|nr:hypothetical protein B0T22DRAFT_478459 [Podospora appendiculata]